MKFSTAYAYAWIATSAAVIAALCLTKDGNCLWGFVFPVCISYHSEDN